MALFFAALFALGMIWTRGPSRVTMGALALALVAFEVVSNV